ncbi:hypothetical protein HJFPF1_08607 [Paramyrothecium foliicola]|nr:hypothetical protein HJFPF1_08607 [Paramyrothecium foliicola]
MTALKCLASEQQFKNQLIPENSESLAEFIIRGLRLFLCLCLESQHASHRRPPDQQESAGVEILTEILSQALGPKVNLLLDLTQYRYLFFKPDDVIDPKSMQLDSWQSAESSNTQDQKKRQ